MDKEIERIRKEISDKAQEFCLDNPRWLGQHLVIETAMLLGASVVLCQPIDLDKPAEWTAETEEALRQLLFGDKDPGRCPCGEDH